jgi:5-methylcytosine-specific restriction endonuclease McrA
VTLKAGGLNRVENLQTLCETCNLQKMPEDALAVQSTRGI